MSRSEKERVLKQSEKLLQNQKNNIDELVKKMENNNPHFIYNKHYIDNFKIWSDGVIYGMNLVIDNCVKK
jgi:hypothetical protein